MPSPSPAPRLDDAIRRANQYRHEAFEKPCDAAVLNFLADLALAGMKEEGHG